MRVSLVITLNWVIIWYFLPPITILMGVESHLIEKRTPNACSERSPIIRNDKEEKRKITGIGHGIFYKTHKKVQSYMSLRTMSIHKNFTN